MSGIFRKSFIWFKKRKRQSRRIAHGLFKTPFGKANPYSYIQHVHARSSSFSYNVLNFFFYVFENLIDIIIFLNILLTLIGALFKYLFLHVLRY